MRNFHDGFPPNKQAHKGESPKHQHPVSVKPLAKETNSINMKYIYSDMSTIKNRIPLKQFSRNYQINVTNRMIHFGKKQTLPASLLQRRFSRVMLSKRREFHLRILDFLADHFFDPDFRLNDSIDLCGQVDLIYLITVAGSCYHNVLPKHDMFSTFSPIIMEVENYLKWKVTPIGRTHFPLPWLWEKG